MTVQGYLAPVVTPHIYQHVPEQYHRDIHELVQPIPMHEVADRLGYTAKSYSNHRARHVRDLLGLTSKGDGWRVQLTRLYCGIDRCWCQR